MNLRRLCPRHQKERFVFDREVGQTLHDRARRVDDRVGNFSLEGEIRLPVLLRAADDCRVVVGIGTAERVVKTHEAAAAFEVRLERRLFVGVHAAGIALVHDDHVGVRDLRRGREMQRPVDDRAALGQNLAPIGKILRVIVLSGPVGLQPGTNVDAQRWSARQNALTSSCGRR